ncbi:Fe(3+) ABC transporter substrate-binding protein [Caviibacter abscessus]|uniref:Fe(3+) ABC transporter substrate-binding protein n=1 Tax=Caviibacter abscessus TaxID=1766719 RepID=UPI000834EDC8|nr:Fe(3+) ABC transporter substrate-binding protein [Caviibacter abscessus]
MKKIFLAISMIFANFALAAGVVNVYTSRHYDVDKKIYEEFEKETGIKVNAVQNTDVNVLIKKMELEGKNTDADVFLTVGVGDLYRAKKLGLLQAVKSSKIEKNVPKQFRDKANNWIGISYRARIFVYNPEKVNPTSLSTYEDLATSKWKGKVLTRSSTSSYNQHLIAFMNAKNGEKSTIAWAKGLTSNFARDPKGNDRDQAKEVLKGTGDVAIMNSYYMGRMTVSKDPLENQVAAKLKIFFPNQKTGGTHINLSGAGLAKYAKNKANAIRFIEFLTEKYAQKVISHENFEYPTNPKAEISPIVKSWGTFKASKIDFDLIGEKMEKSSSIANEAKWK